ncbi:MAG: putative 2-aminoethylphosphonate ABC transporter substrate-binding protein, partial [Alphaproteobacteria bacterium]|nr:putative 2-aminoethylphosphonate ABC transporter substrate-binding protein [Alphaproteobacteria bacterium]
MLKRILMASAAALMAIAAGQADAQQKTRVTVYTALESDQLQPYKQAFESENPDIDIQWVREST